MKITDLRKIIQEIISESFHYERNFKVPSLEDQHRIQRELKRKIDFSNCIKSTDDLDSMWFGKSHIHPSPGKYIVGYSIKEINSTLDEGYSALIVGINEENPFHAAKYFSCMGYGPTEFMEQLQKSMEYDLYETGIGSYRAVRRVGRFLNEDGFDHDIELRFKNNMIEYVARKGIKLKISDFIPPRKDETKKIFPSWEEFKDAYHFSLQEIQHYIETKRLPYVKSRVLTADYNDHFEIMIYNRYTMMLLAVIPICTDKITYKGGRGDTEN